MSLPASFEQMYRACFGEPAWVSYTARASEPLLRGLRLNPLKQGNALPHSFTVGRVPWTEHGYYVATDMRLGKDPLHAAGAYYLQEPSAMAPVSALAPQPSERVLDLCAAPGGKTTQIASAMAGAGVLVANELVHDRCVTLAENCERMGVRNAVITQLSPDAIADHYPLYFDAILVDAPCSGEGMVRREPTVERQWHDEFPAECAAIQISILTAAVQALRPGGRLVYSTCTINPLENELVCAKLLTIFPALRLCAVNLPATSPGLSWSQLIQAGQHSTLVQQGLTAAMQPSTEEGIPCSPTVDLTLTRRIMPHDGRGEGHFFALFTLDSANQLAQRETTPSASAHQTRTKERLQQPKKVQVTHRQSSADREFILAWEQLATRLLSTDSTTASAQSVVSFAHSTTPSASRPAAEQKLAVSSDILYAIATSQAPVRGVLRNGLPLLTKPHSQHLPAHALAMTLSANQAQSVLRLSYGDERALLYLYGASISDASCSDGWTLVTLEGFPLGWAKAVHGVLKNHYPKGLRRAYLFVHTP